MKQMCLIAILSLGVVSCGSDPVARPFAAQPVKKKAKVRKEPKKELQKEIEKAPPEPNKKESAGKVTFSNLSGDQLAALRVIPETGQALFQPKNQTYDQVDGFWWQGGKPDEWFKIPDFSEAWIGQAPEEFDGIAHRNGLQVFYRSSPLVRLAGVIGNGVRHPDWVRNSGQTTSPVPSPWNHG